MAASTLSKKTLSPARTTAQRASSDVKCLDIKQSHVGATLEAVAQVAEQKTCVLWATGSMGALQDWETGVSF